MKYSNHKTLKAIQHNTNATHPRQSFSKKNELPLVGHECINAYQLKYPTPDHELPATEPDVELIFNLGMGLVVNEAHVQAQQNPPPDGMRTCGNFTWTVEGFNQKLQFNPDEHTSERFAVWKIIVIAAGGFILIALLVTIIAFIWNKLRKKRQGGYNLLRCY